MGVIDTYLFERELLPLHIRISLICNVLYMMGSIYHICDTSFTALRRSGAGAGPCFVTVQDLPRRVP